MGSISATNRSMPSIAADVIAAAQVRPLPLSTVIVADAGRTATATGTPIVSIPVMSPTRVIAARPRWGRIRANVSSGGIARCVPQTNSLCAV